MRNNSGITMISLAVTLIILALLAGIGISLGLDSYETSKVQNFIATMKIIQGKVDQIAEMSDKSAYLNGTPNENNEYYYTAQDLKNKLGLKGIDMAVYINFETREIRAENGIKADMDYDGEDEIYYNHYNLNGGEKLYNK